MERTTRERIVAALRERPMSAADLSTAVGVPTATVYDHLRHVARTLDGGGGEGQLLVAPPECADCGFAGFDDPVNEPSRCPECRSERIEEPLFRVE